jgi:prepilin-type processing-associated H-X9-DG protein
MNEPPPTRPTLHPGALLSFLLGVSSFALCLLALSGVPALLIGYRSLRSVNASDGRRTGARLAVGGMVLGGLGTLATLGGLLALLIVQLQLRATRTNCQDNLRRVGFALYKYEGGAKTFPPAVVGPQGLPPHKQLAWTCDVVPHLGVPLDGKAPQGRQKKINERFEEIAAQVDRTQAWDAESNATAVGTVIRQLRCPASPDLDPNRSPGLTNYVGLAGIGPDAGSLPREDARAGFFGYARGVKKDEIESGTSYVIMVLETARDLGPWLAGGPPTLRELAAGEDQYTGPERAFGGMHPGATNVLWADGSVRPVSDRMPGDVLRQHATLKGRR